MLEKYLPRTEFSSYDDFKKNFKIEKPKNFDFAKDIVDGWAKIDPDKRALVYCADEPGSERTFSFGDISLLSKRAATWFLNHGIKKGDRVLTLMRRRWEYWIVAVALCRIGAVVVPCCIQMTEKDISYRINNSKAKIVLALADGDVLKQLKNIRSKCNSLETIATIGESKYGDMTSFTNEFIQCEPYEGDSGARPTDEMIVYFTSGTTGYPKMAVHNRYYPLGHIVTAKYMQRVQDNGLHMTQTDSGWAKFGWGNIYGQWICGSAILGYDPIRFNTHHMMDIMKRFEPTSICIPPTMYRFLIHDGIMHEHVQSIKWFSTAGEPLSGKVNAKFKEISGQYIHEGFGQSEGTPITCGFEWLKIKPSSMGKPSPLYDVRIIHPDGTRCATNEVGEIVIYVKNGTKQIGLLDYYYYDGEKIDPVVDGIYHTGDTAYEDEDGYYWYVGRVDDMIKCSGYRIGPFEIESILNAHESVKESAIIGIPDAIRGQIVCAAIVLKDGYQPSEALTRELQTFVKENTAPYKYPRKIVYLNEIPKTSSGKIIRHKTKDIVDEILKNDIAN